MLSFLFDTPYQFLSTHLTVLMSHSMSSLCLVFPSDIGLTPLGVTVRFLPPGTENFYVTLRVTLSKTSLFTILMWTSLSLLILLVVTRFALSSLNINPGEGRGTGLSLSILEYYTSSVAQKTPSSIKIEGSVETG